MDRLNPYSSALRDLVLGRVRDHQRRLRRFDDNDLRRYAELLDAMFLLAVDRRFRPGQDCAPVIRFVAGVRERYDHSGVEIDPATAESLIQAALGQHPPPSMDATTVAAQTMLIVGLLDDEGLSPTELTTLLHAAERQAAGIRSASGRDPETGADGQDEETQEEAESGVQVRLAGAEPGTSPDRQADIGTEERQRG
ncbi:hypothetical protein BDK92_1400 [Micromonospora pisi]|uniref:Uncharacterized protein n=1 Tax=Micromonospora pisi TaxID=589240 RepID=A0A495JDZ5_9ACTN|nr:hypothetical protein BDK92_1400 [Micromonospora pisi]